LDTPKKVEIVRMIDQPQTDAWTPRPFFDPQTPLPLPQPSPTPPEVSLTPGAEAAAEVVGLDAVEAAEVASPGVKPNPRGEGRGVVERLVACTGPACWTGRDPMGPTDPMGPARVFDAVWREDGDSAPPGEEAEVTDCSPKTGFTPELGEEVLLAREGD
jgi:hypothetical protein